MKAGPNNPAENQLPSGATEEKLVEAVNVSGYPLQSRVGAVVTNFMRTSVNGAPGQFAEEWSYIDRTEETLRTLDIRAGLEDKPFDGRGRQRRVTAAMDLLIECKRTRAVTVFFSTAAPIAPYSFPIMAGLRHDLITVETDDDRSTWSYPVQVALGLDTLPFSNAPAAAARFLSQANFRTGGGMELSGETTYAGVVQPLISAVEYFRRTAQALPTFRYVDCRAVLAVCVIDGAMVLVEGAGEGTPSMSLVPWVRVHRSEARPGRHPFHSEEPYAIDFVHFEFLDSYLRDHVEPFYREFVERVRRHESELYQGLGFVAGLGTRRPTGSIETHLRRRRATRRQGGAMRRAAQMLLRWVEGKV